MGGVAGEVVFTVRSSVAQEATPKTLEEVGFKERADLQEWVLGNPQMLGDGPDEVVVITSEFDRWVGAGTVTSLERFDVLGLDRAGRLVVAELKRGDAPSTTIAQALTYAAMSSRFTVEKLAAEYAQFHRRRENSVMTEEEASSRLQSHCGGQLTDETLRRPRIVLMAESFPVPLTTTAVWLNDSGVDVALVKVSAYEAGAETVVSVSKIYPVPDVPIVGPDRRGSTPSTPPVVPWTADELPDLDISITRTARTLLDLCAQRPGEWVLLTELVKAVVDRTPDEINADLAKLTKVIRKEFGRNNWPIEIKGPPSAYRMDHDTAKTWDEVIRNRTP
jgi:hypothetical protein